MEEFYSNWEKERDPFNSNLNQTITMLYPVDLGSIIQFVKKNHVFQVVINL